MLLLSALILGVFPLCLLTRKRFEQVVAPYACGVMLACYPFALARSPEGLGWFFIAAALALTLAAVALCALKRRRLSDWVKLVFTPGFVCFAALTALLCFSVNGRTVWWYDDIRYWALEPKSLFYSGGFTDAAHHLAPKFAAYTPGLPLLQWLGLIAYGDWNESVPFFVLFEFCLCLLAPFSQKITWKKAYWTPLFLAFAIIFPTVFNAFHYYTLSVDTALGLCFGYALCLLWRIRQPGGASAWRITSLTLALCAMVMVKQVGLLLWGLSLALLLVLPRGAQKVKLSRYAIVFGVPALLLASWYALCAAFGYGGMHSSALWQHLGELLGGTWQAPADFERIVPGVWQAITHDLSGYDFMPHRALVEIPCLVQMLLFCAAPFALVPLARQSVKSMRRLSLFSAIVFALELAAIVFAFMTTFYDEVNEYVGQGRNLLSLLINRYFSPVFFGLAL